MESNLAEGVTEEVEKTSQERYIWAESWKKINKISVVCGGKGNRIGQARQPQRARSPQEDARLQEGSFGAWPWHVEMKWLERTQDPTKDSRTMKTRGAFPWGWCQRGRGCSRKGCKETPPTLEFSLALHFWSWLSMETRWLPRLSGGTFNLQDPRPQLHENLILFKHIICSGVCKHCFQIKMLDVYFYCLRRNYSENLMIHFIPAKANTTTT